MAIPILSSGEIQKMRIAGKAAAEVLDFIAPHVREGVSTETLNTLCHEYIVGNGDIPAPLNYHGFPKSICTSINNVICHGIPSEEEILRDGDILNIDITVIRDGYYGDTSRMFCIGNVSEKAKKLVERTEKAMYRGISAVKPGARLNDIGIAIEKYISQFQYGIVRDFTGHGIGSVFHTDPAVLHYDTKRPGPLLRPGMVFTIEPMINESRRWQSVIDNNDGWTVRTTDGALSAQYEHTILVTETGYEILTQR